MPSFHTITIDADEAEYYRLGRLLDVDLRELTQERVEALATGIVLGEVYHASADNGEDPIKNILQTQTPPAA
jgi:uncharacterized phage-associated protein